MESISLGVAYILFDTIGTIIEFLTLKEPILVRL